MSEEIVIEVTSEEVAREIAYGIDWRADEIHENHDNEFEHIALELKYAALDLLEQYE